MTSTVQTTEEIDMYFRILGEGNCWNLYFYHDGEGQRIDRWFKSREAAERYMLKRWDGIPLKV